MLAVGLALGVIAIAGLPPFGVFTSEFMLVSSSFARQPLLAVVLVFGLIVAFGALILRLQDVLFGEPTGPVGQVKASYLPLFVHLALVLMAGLWLPEPVVRWFRAVAAQLGMTANDANHLARLLANRTPVAGHRPWPRYEVDHDAVDRRSGRRWATGGGDLLGLWGDKDIVHMAIARRGAAGALRRVDPRSGTATFPRSAASIRRRSGWSARSAISTASRRSARRTGGRGSITAPGACARRSARAPPAALRDPAPYEFLPVQGEGLHQIPVGPVHAGIIEPGHFRFTANGETVARLEERLGYVHKGIDGLTHRRRYRAGGARHRARLRRFHRGLQLRLRARGRSGARRRAAAARQGAARRDGGARARRQSLRRHRRDLQRRVVRADPRPLRHFPRARAGGDRPRLRPPPDDGPHRAGRRRGHVAGRRARHLC